MPLFVLWNGGRLADDCCMVGHGRLIVQHQPAGLPLAKLLLAHVGLQHYFQIVFGNIGVIDIGLQNRGFPAPVIVTDQDPVAR